MKNIIAVILTVFISFPGLSQVKTNTTQKAKPAPVTPPKPVLKDLKDSASYAMGIFLVNVYQQQGISGINSAVVARAVDDLQFKKPRLLDDNQANSVILSYVNKLQQEKSKPNIEAGEKFLAQNKTKPGITTTASGLQYEVITMGTGQKPAAGDSVVCHYKGSYIDGTVFENSYTNGFPITFAVNRVISGWTEGLQLMPAGSKFRLFIPYTLGYGPSDYYAIPGGSALIFEIELLEVRSKPQN